MKITKKSGERVNFDREKLKRSLQHSGANSEQISRVLLTIENEIYDGMPTKKIYKMAFQLLKKNSKIHAALYNLKTAIQSLGPAGFFFEKFIARLFAADNYQTEVNLILNGKCVTHEIDVLIKKNNHVAMVECKFHGNKDTSSDVKIPMYILSRFNDVKNSKHFVFNENSSIDECWVITNNRFTTEAIEFGFCSGLKMLSWDFPEKGSLKYRIEKAGLYPITCLTTLTKIEKEELLTNDILLAKELISHSEMLGKIGVHPNRIQNILNEASGLV